MMLVSKTVLEDINSIKPPVPLIAFFPHPTCVAQRLHARSKPAFLRSISTVVVKDKQYISKQDWPDDGDFDYDDMKMVNDANLWRLLREYFSDMRQIEYKETVYKDGWRLLTEYFSDARQIEHREKVDTDVDKDHVVVEIETAYEVSKVKTLLGGEVHLDTEDELHTEDEHWDRYDQSLKRLAEQKKQQRLTTTQLNERAETAEARATAAEKRIVELEMTAQLKAAEKRIVKLETMLANMMNLID